MNTHLPADLEQFVQAKVRSGRFSSSDEVMATAVRLLRQQEEAETVRKAWPSEIPLRKRSSRRFRPSWHRSAPAASAGSPRR